MAVVHVVDRVMRGHGRGLSALALAEAQHRAGWDVRLLVSGVRSPELLPAAPAPEPLLGDSRTDVYRDVSSIDRVHAALGATTEAGDTIVSHEGVDLAAGCRLGHRAVVAAIHSDPASCVGFLPADDLAAVRHTTDHWIAWGARSAETLMTSFGIEPRRITISGQSVTPSRSAVRDMAGSPACVTVARIHPVKNHALMVEALAVLARSLPEVHWHMVGGCEDEAYLRGLQRTAARLDVGHLITWHGYRTDVAAIVRGCDVAVLASHSEGVPRAIQEAMVLRVPTVMPAAFTGNLSQCGLPIEYHPQVPRRLAEAITTAQRVDPRRVTAAAERVERRWGWASVLSDWDQAVGGAPLRSSGPEKPGHRTHNSSRHQEHGRGNGA